MNYILILIGLLSSSFLNAQVEEDRDSFFIDLSVARFAKFEHRFSNSDRSDIDFINGFKFGFQKSNDKELYVSLMKLHSVSEGFRAGSILNSRTGYQIGLGINKVVGRKNRLSCSIGGEMILHFVNYEGFVIGPNDGWIPLSNLKTYQGGTATVFQLNYKLTESCIINCNTRLGAYYSSTPSNDYFLSNTSSFDILYEPVNSLGLRVNL